MFVIAEMRELVSNAMKQPMKFISAICLVALLSGCIALPSKSGTGRVLVVGIGLVTVNDRPDAAIIATSSQVLGMEVSDRAGLKFAVGYASGVVTQVSDGAEDVRAEVSRTPFGPVSVEVQTVKMRVATNYVNSGGIE